jgi:hypothetical protein
MLGYTVRAVRNHWVILLRHGAGWQVHCNLPCCRGDFKIPSLPLGLRAQRHSWKANDMIRKRSTLAAVSVCFDSPGKTANENWALEMMMETVR